MELAELMVHNVVRAADNVIGVFRYRVRGASLVALLRGPKPGTSDSIDR